MNWKGIPLDAAVLPFMYPQGYYAREVTCGIHGMGKYQLRNLYIRVCQPASSIPSCVLIIPPNQVVAYVKNEVNKKLLVEQQELDEAEEGDEKIDILENVNVLADEFIKLVESGEAETTGWYTFFDKHNVPEEERTNMNVDMITRTALSKKPDLFEK